MIRQLDNVFVLDTDNTTYCFEVDKTGLLFHLYYGERIRIDDAKDVEVLREKHAFAPGNVSMYDDENTNFTPEDIKLEISSQGKGDIRESFVEIVYPNGSVTSDFIYESAQISKGKSKFVTMPSSYADEDRVMQLNVNLKERHYDVILTLSYCVFEDKDVITRSATLINRLEESIRLKKLMSMQLDLSYDGYVLSTFGGAWAREMSRFDTKVMQGTHVNSSFTGTSSNRANPFFMLSKEHTTQSSGMCMGFNLIYSGNHYESVSVNSFGKTRVLSGINPSCFEFILDKDDVFEAPEAVMTYTMKGFNGMSANMHRFVRENIVRGKWKNKERPVLLNSWEAAYFDINESRLVKLAKAAAGVGIELFVMDDGWFGKRNDDKTSLGDWYVNKEKLPGGLKSLSDKIHGLGLDFGIWVEPEMINEESELYNNHPDWALKVPDRNHSKGRNQMILDLTNPDVCEYIISAMEDVFRSCDINYVKWDMNRNFTDAFSTYLDSTHQGELFHRYVCGLYKIIEKLTEEFPDILFEGCSAGGNRFDLGILCYFPQIWASDDTDALYRVNGQTGYSYGYPQSVYTAHVSACPNHQTLRNVPLNTRFNVASFALLGYECNLCDMGSKELDSIKEQVELYKRYRKVFQFGQLYRGRDDNLHEWTVVSEDGKVAIGMLMQELAQPNPKEIVYMPVGLKAECRYHFENIPMKHNIKEFGDLINTQTPVHIKPDSVLHNAVAKFVTMPGEHEDYVAYGDVLMKGGIHLKQSFGATGYSEQVRHFPDFASRMYFMSGEE